jgi:hypothetical protein
MVGEGSPGTDSPSHCGVERIVDSPIQSVQALAQAGRTTVLLSGLREYRWQDQPPHNLTIDAEIGVTLDDIMHAIKTKGSPSMDGC